MAVIEMRRVLRECRDGVKRCAAATIDACVKKPEQKQKLVRVMWGARA